MLLQLTSVTGFLITHVMSPDLYVKQCFLLHGKWFMQVFMCPLHAPEHAGIFQDVLLIQLH